ncbi:hypothetical protein BZB76_6112 [Actinomadura pelletieri DSM 43383]|uniref:Uncharacterized protein n=1 Tax=Actinomadura pelletieri DSM 43383 TaxID=1120940 RepID=A0A495QBU8_9ACTN|nr:hypothetical protein BZB76_6112 [Actinomadura pelletieri DSM 43383]
MEIEEIDPVVTEQVGLDRLGVLGQELVEADPSPGNIPESRP